MPKKTRKIFMHSAFELFGVVSDLNKAEKAVLEGRFTNKAVRPLTSAAMAVVLITTGTQYPTWRKNHEARNPNFTLSVFSIPGFIKPYCTSQYAIQFSHER